MIRSWLQPSRPATARGAARSAQPGAWRGLLVALLVTATPVLADAADDRGARLARERCAACHGADGRGNAIELPSLAGQHAEYIVRQIFHFKTRERANPAMLPIVEALSADDIEQVARHFSTMPPRRSPGRDPVLLAAGRDLYESGLPAKGLAACASCHGARGVGGALMPRIAGQAPTYVQKQLRAFANHARDNDRGMHTALAAMDERDLLAVSAWVGHLD